MKDLNPIEAMAVAMSQLGGDGAFLTVFVHTPQNLAKGFGVFDFAGFLTPDACSIISLMA
jgi:hypothetical protein